MAENKQFKVWKLFAIFGGVILIAASVAAPIAFITSCGETNPIKPSKEVFNGLTTNLSNSQEEVDKNALEWYKNNTASIFVSNLDSNEGSMGTVWNWPTPVGQSGHFFATNIHVINSVLEHDSTNDSWSIKDNSTFQFYKQDEKPSWLFPLKDIEIFKIYASSDIPGLTTQPGFDVDWYSDLAIVSSTSEIFAGKNSLNFIDTESEFNWFTDSMENNKNDLIFYLCGFPANKAQDFWPSVASWTTARYQWDDKVTNYQKWKNEYRLTNANVSLSSYGTNDYLKGTEKGLKIVEGENWYRNYANQLVLPGLSLGGGSSGSLVMVKHENTFKPIGIYWGVYTSTSATETFSAGGIDLFYWPAPYNYSNMNSKEIELPAYDHTPK